MDATVSQAANWGKGEARRHLMRGIAQRVLALGVLFLLSPVWLFSLVGWVAKEKWKSESLSRHYDFYCFLDGIHTSEILYIIGVVITCVAAWMFAFDKFQHDPANFLSVNFRGLFTVRLLANRIMALGVLFLLAPAWCFPFISDLALSMVNARYKNTGYTFMDFDGNCVMLEFGTIKILYHIGIAVTCLAALLFALGYFNPKRLPDCPDEDRV